MANKARIISEEELNELYPKNESKSKNSARIISEQELEDYTRTKSLSELNETATIGDYLRAVPATGVDIAAGAAEGVASAIGEFTGDYDLARSISETRTDINDAIMGDAPDSVKSDFAYKVASGLGSTIPYLGAALLARKPSLLAKVGANGFFLASAGQQVRDDYLGTQGVTSETATDEQMSESNKVGAMGAIPIAMAEKLGAGVILGAFKGGAIPAGQVMQRISQYAMAGAGEAATEVAQSGIINSIASYVGKYDPERPITQGMAESALIGFLVGGGVNAGIDTVERAVTQADRLQAGVKDGSINAKDVIDEDIGSKFAAIAMENDGVPEADGYREAQITDPKGMSNFISKTLTPLSQRLGRAGKEVVREFRRYEMNTGLKLKEFKDATSPFSKKMLELKKKSPEDYKILSQALANANELSAPLPSSVQKDLEQKAQLQPEVTRSASEQLLDTTNENAQTINEQIGLARKALESSGLKTRIQVVESGNSYYDPSTNTIAISATEADTTTVAHEYFHAVLGQAVKTDVELQSMTRNMFDSVIRATVSGSSINEQLKGFVSQYDSNVQNEEFLAQTVGELASQYETLDVNTRTRIKVWINQVMQKLGVSGVFKEAETDAEVIDQLNAFARFSGSAEGLTGVMSSSQASQLSNGEITGMGSPVRGTRFQQADYSEMQDNIFPDKPLPLSLITKKNKIDISAIMDDVINNNKRVAFFAADQLGVGKNGDFDLDGGPSFAFTKKGVFWMSGSKDKLDNSTAMNKYAEESDYIFVFSGSATMHTFNKSVFNGFAKSMKSKYKTYDAFRDAFIEGIGSNPNKEAKAVIDNLNRYKSFDSFRDEGDGSPPPRKGLLNYIDKFSQKTNDTPTRQFLRGLNLDLDSLRDNFYKENDYGWLDLMVVGKPKGKTKKGDFHSTYADQFMGETLGVPDKKVNLKDLLSVDEYNKLISKFVADRKRKALKDKSEAFTEDAIEKRMAKYKQEVSQLKRIANDPQAQADRIQQKELDFIAKMEYTTEREESDRQAAEEPQSSLADKINYNAGGMKSYDASQLRSLNPQQVASAISRKKPVKIAKAKPATPEQIKSGAKAARKSQLDRSTASVNFRKWMGKGQLIHDDGEPMVLYHGSKQDDITSFKSARSEGLIFFSTNPEFAENWVRGIGGIRDRKSPAGIKQREEREKRNREQDKEWERSVDWNRVEREQDTLGESPYYEEMYKKHPRKSRMSDMVIDTAIYPVYLNSKKIFDPRVDFKIAEDFVLREAKKTGIQSEVDATNDLIRQGQYKIGNWIAYENKPMVDFLKTKGYDTMLLSEDASAKGSDAAHETLAVFSPNMVKSATGNNGEYSLSDPDIRRQKPRTASDEEMARGLSNDGMRILQKYGMTEDYKGVRSVLDRIKGEYEDLGLDKNFIENYFPRLVQDLNGLKASYGQKTGIVDQEIRRYEKTTGQTLSDIERQMMFEKLARSNMYRSGLSAPSNMKERITDFIQEPQMKYYADPEVALDNYIDKMVNAIETKRLIGDSASGKTQGADPVAGRLGEVMDKMASEGRLRDDQINLIRGAIDARFGSHGAQYGFIKGAKNMGYLATMGNVGSTLTQLGDFYFTMVQNGLIPTVEAALGRKDLTVEDLGIAKNMVEIDSKQGGGMFSNSVNNVFKWTGLTAMDRLAKNTNINATHKVLTKGAKAGQNTNSYKKTLARLKRVQGNDAYKTIADLKNGVKSEYVIEAIYNNLADVAPISLTEMPEAYAGNPNLRIMYSLKSYTIKQFNFVRERVWTKLMQGIATKNPKMIGEASTDMMKILAFSTLANGSSDVLKSIIFNREIDEEDFMWNTLLRIFGITKYTTVQVRKEGLGTAALKTIAPPQFGMMSDVFKDAQEMERIQDMRSVKYVPFVGKLYYWAEGRGVEIEEKLSRLREKPLYQEVTYPDPPRQK
mgnify:CR=1 FL=1